MTQCSRLRIFLQILAFTTAAASMAMAAELPTPKAHFTDLSGQQQSLSAYQGKIVVLNFWATWCGPCREELPMLNELAGPYSQQNVVFIAASIDDLDTRNKVGPYLEKGKITLPVWLGASADTLKEFLLGEIIPATIIFDQDGAVAARIFGEARRKDITSRLDWLLEGKQGKAPKAALKRY